MPELEPITREEKLLDGEDLTPITRKEQFIKRIYDKTQEIPEPITREEMFLKKAGEGGGGDIDLQTLNVTENGTVNAPSGVAYNKVVTDVPQPTMTKLTATENRTYTAPSGTAYDEVDVDVPLPSNAYLLKELSNLPQPIASFSDGSDNPLKSLTASIVPVQDLHGYDSPWAGGAGKNKFDVDLPHEENSGTATYSYTVTVKANTDYTMSSNVPQGTPASLYFNGENTGANGVWNGTPRTFTSDENGTLTVLVRFSTSQGGIDLYTAVKNGQYYIQLEEGSTATTYEPYSNICPISGWTEEVITRTGKNLLKPEATSKTQEGVTYTVNDNGTITVSGTATGYSSISLGIARVKSSMGQITISGIDDTTNIMWAGIDVWDKDRQLVVSITSGSQSPTLTFDLTPYPNACFISAGVKRNSNVATSGTIKPQIELGTTATEYTPYAGTTTTIPFTDSQGNPVEVYGGSVDVVNGGEQPRTLGSVDMGDMNWTYSSGSGEYFTGTIPGCIIPTIYSNHKPMCEVYKGKNPNYINTLNNGEIMYNTTFGAVFVKDTNYTDATLFKNSVAGKKLVYELATPTNFYTQPTSIKSLDGDNNVFASTGDVEELKYFSKEAE